MIDPSGSRLDGGQHRTIDLQLRESTKKRKIDTSESSRSVVLDGKLDDERRSRRIDPSGSRLEGIQHRTIDLQHHQRTKKRNGLDTSESVKHQCLPTTLSSVPFVFLHPKPSWKLVKTKNQKELIAEGPYCNKIQQHMAGIHVVYQSPIGTQITVARDLCDCPHGQSRVHKECPPSCQGKVHKHVPDIDRPLDPTYEFIDTSLLEDTDIPFAWLHNQLQQVQLEKNQWREDYS